jgi:hypothetical protein
LCVRESERERERERERARETKRERDLFESDITRGVNGRARVATPVHQP